MKERSKIILNSGKDQSVKRFHPWVFSGAIKKIKGPVADGDTVEVFSNHDEPLGLGHYQDGSIAVRMITFGHDLPADDTGIFREKIKRAYDIRTSLGLTRSEQTNVYRLIFAEGDGLPGLIADYYNGTVVVQCHSIGMHKRLDTIASVLREVMGEDLRAIYDKSAETLPKQYAAGVANAVIYGSPQTNEVLENGCKFSIDWETGQKTGFFVDQRENRDLLGRYSKGKKVLNTFCYSGGFSVYALQNGATLVDSVDSSKKAIELTDRNIALNFGETDKHRSFAMDTFDFFDSNKEEYDIIILDPPAFAKHQNVKHNAVQGYKRLNAEAMRRIKSGGILFTFSCSQVVDRELFFHTVHSAAIQAGREVRIMHYLSQPPDHANSIFHPEGEYLKGMVVSVH